MLWNIVNYHIATNQWRLLKTIIIFYQAQLLMLSFVRFSSLLLLLFQIKSYLARGRFCGRWASNFQMEMYSRGQRGFSAKEIGRLFGARVRIPPSPFAYHLDRRNNTIYAVFSAEKTFFKKIKKSCWQTKTDVVLWISCRSRNEMNTAKWTLITKQWNNPENFK